ncbi:uncharacterized protein K452DRAFT_346027 [Aplosporella prunicola CBS 121167]|uniref:ATP-grasp domain-containing protein n=1 Tax=Aplosporella prunicola CBS 121167 TaxID=1176127 RepID=A0A6A6AW65_9PEZI|nr:uncharacterized protein K452DRAFT_346027 [Aplosporella prunicola CBS 121167]KAF2135836.1 hypothetical protein K452DRAFT_346027 [Aplosporella prunicola CBS 121167]
MDVFWETSFWAHSLRTPFTRRAYSSGKPRVALLYQALDPPIINGVRTPKEQGGYRDSGTDIAYVLREQSRVDICFPDDEQGIIAAVHAGANHLWANIVLFKDHSLQISSALDTHGDIRVIGQPPLVVETFEDKHYLNGMLRQRGSTVPKSCVLTPNNIDGLRTTIWRGGFTSAPSIAKPIRGRGSHGIKHCLTPQILEQHIRDLFAESPMVMVEEYLSGQEVTVAVMPPMGHVPYLALPVVTRFGHAKCVLPPSGTVALTTDSRAVGIIEEVADRMYRRIIKECEQVAKLLQTTAPISFDVRRYRNQGGSPFAIFDVNMNPDMSGPGRPGRENQASLIGLAAEGYGINYPELL